MAGARTSCRPAPYRVLVARPLPPALLAVLPRLRCPVCALPLTAAERTLGCAGGHRFDASRAGSVSLLAGPAPVSGDDDAMARARDRFLATGAYAPLRDAVLDLAADDACAPASGERSVPRLVVDAGCGSGWYLAGLLEEDPGALGVGLDTSTRSLRFAARAHERLAAIGADLFSRLPLEDGAADVVLDVFSPRNPGEFARVLRPGGRLVVARPSPDHLAELRGVVPAMVGIDPRKEERLTAALDPYFRAGPEIAVRAPLTLDTEAATDLVLMTPSARHVDPASLHLPEQVETTLSVLVSVFLKR